MRLRRVKRSNDWKKSSGILVGKWKFWSKKSFGNLLRKISGYGSKMIFGPPKPKPRPLINTLLQLLRIFAELHYIRCHPIRTNIDLEWPMDLRNDRRQWRSFIRTHRRQMAGTRHWWWWVYHSSEFQLSGISVQFANSASNSNII